MPNKMFPLGKKCSLNWRPQSLLKHFSAYTKATTASMCPRHPHLAKVSLGISLSPPQYQNTSKNKQQGTNLYTSQLCQILNVAQSVSNFLIKPHLAYPIPVPIPIFDASPTHKHINLMIPSSSVKHSLMSTIHTPSSVHSFNYIKAFPSFSSEILVRTLWRNFQNVYN